MTVALSLIIALSAWLSPADVSFQASKGKKDYKPSPNRFTFVRVEYESVGGYGEAYYDYDGRFWYRWQTDYPEAEQNFLYRIEELTTLKVNRVPISLKLTDEALFDYPFVYMCDVGWQMLGEKEVIGLRQYLLRGGFLWVDDFWGHAEWQNFEYNMRVAFPDLRWKEIPRNHPILKVVFPLENCPQVPAKIFWEQARLPFDPPSVHRAPHGGLDGVNRVNFRGLWDKKGRLMAVATHNSDIGDGWEREGESEQYFEEFSTRSYAIGINILVYALTH